MSFGEGRDVGFAVRNKVGIDDVIEVGRGEGCAVGLGVGGIIGTTVSLVVDGTADGKKDETAVGIADCNDARITVGLTVGSAVDRVVGEGVGVEIINDDVDGANA